MSTDKPIRIQTKPGAGCGEPQTASTQNRSPETGINQLGPLPHPTESKSPGRMSCWPAPSPKHLKPRQPHSSHSTCLRTNAIRPSKSQCDLTRLDGDVQKLSQFLSNHTDFHEAST